MEGRQKTEGTVTTRVITATLIGEGASIAGLERTASEKRSIEGVVGDSSIHSAYSS
jgi:hypothetical protein